LLHTTRSSRNDLAVGGELSGLPKGTVRYVRYQDLLALDQESYTVTDDPSIRVKTEISGVALTTLAKLFGQAAHSDMIVAICSDKYRSNYSREYMAAHHPILVLKVNGQLNDHWPPSEYKTWLGPYFISHPVFHPSEPVLSYKDEPHVPFEVTRLDFRTEEVVFGAIEPPGKWDVNSSVWKGYRIAREDCYRCHSSHGEGGQSAERTWQTLAMFAAANPERFQRYVRKPTSVRKSAKMAPHEDFDDATLAALTAYFQTFTKSRTTP